MIHRITKQNSLHILLSLKIYNFYCNKILIKKKNVIFNVRKYTHIMMCVNIFFFQVQSVFLCYQDADYLHGGYDGIFKLLNIVKNQQNNSINSKYSNKTKQENQIGNKSFGFFFYILCCSVLKTFYKLLTVIF